MMTRFPRLLPLLVFATMSLPAMAKGKKARDANRKTVDDFTASVTLSPVHLTIPLAEVTGEYKVADKVGAAVVLGGGKGNAGGIAASYLEGGAQGRYYVLGDFRSGAMVGAELLALKVTVDDPDVEASGSGVFVGPFVGGKHVFDVGFTVDGQIGYQFGVVGASASDGETSADASDSGGIVLLNLNLGWSF